ncbi:MAG: TonB-dependent receptor [Opitutaceae bacterium]|nr:TonB-dependent receptor [Opitutaceae bacterium]
MKIPPSSFRGGAFLAVALAATGAVGAQPARSGGAEDVIKLEEFSVTDSVATGYRATNSITATGIGMKISETPIPISVVTSELIADVSADTLSEALTYVSGVGTSPRNESTFLVRGFSGLISYRNGQYRRQLFTTYNVDRVEVAKGAAGIFFGTVRPGGVINYITRRPKLEQSASTEVRAAMGKHNYYKGEVYHNQPLSKQFGFSVGLAVLDAGGDQQFEYNRERFANVGFTWRPADRHSLVLELENIDRSRFYLSSYGSRAVTNSRWLNNPVALAFPVNQSTTAAATAMRNWLNSQGYSANPLAPNFVPTFDIFAPIYGPIDPQGRTISLTSDARQTQRSKTVDLDYLFKISNSLVWQTNLNYAYDNTSGIQPSNGDTNPYADGSLRFQTESFINKRYSYNIDNKLNWRFEAVGGRHVWMLGQEFQSVDFLRPGYRDAQLRYNNSPLGAFVTNFRPGVSPHASVYQSINASGQDFNINRWTLEEQFGAFFAGQSNFFNQRLFMIYGGRYTSFKQKYTYSVPVSNGQTGEADPGVSPQAAILFKVTPEISVFANGSRAVEPNYSIDADGNASEPIKSKSADFGLKTELMKGRLVSTITYYDLERGNLAYNDVAKQAAIGRSPYFIYGNTEVSSGIEADFNLSPTDNYQLMFSYNHFIKAEVSQSNDVTRIGAPLNYNPANSYKLWNRYNITEGALKGLAIGAGLRHSDGARLSGDPLNQVMMPAFTTYDLMFSYATTIGGRRVSAQLNIKNVTDKLYRDGTDGYFADKRNVIFSVRTKF